MSPFTTFIGDGAYDGELVTQAVWAKKPDARGGVRPGKTAVLSPTGETQRDRPIDAIDQKGRMAWQRMTGYSLRSYLELATHRYQTIFGNAMKARRLPQQRTEA